MTELLGKTIGELRALLVGKQVKAREIAEAHLSHAQAVEDRLAAFNSFTHELALSQAERVDEMVARGDTLPPLAGIPVAIKDNMCVADYPTTCSSKILADFVPPYTGTVPELSLIHI